MGEEIALTDEKMAIQEKIQILRKLVDSYWKTNCDNMGYA